MTWLTPQVIIPAVVGITILVTFIWKCASKADINSLKADTETHIKSLKNDLKGDIESLKRDIKDDINKNREDLMEVRQNLFNHLSGHPIPSPAKTETRHADPGPPGLEELKKREKGESTADEHDRRTRS